MGVAITIAKMSNCSSCTIGLVATLPIPWWFTSMREDNTLSCWSCHSWGFNQPNQWGMIWNIWGFLEMRDPTTRSREHYWLGLSISYLRQPLQYCMVHLVLIGMIWDNEMIWHSQVGWYKVGLQLAKLLDIMPGEFIGLWMVMVSKSATPAGMHWDLHYLPIQPWIVDSGTI